MAMTDTELNAKFDGIQNSISSVEKLLKTIIDNQDKNISRNEKRIDVLDDRMNLNDTKTLSVENKLDNHLETHNKISGNKKFSIEMIVLVGIFVLDKVGNWIKPLIP